ncbi:MAG: hypothetical protein ACXWV5_11025 [Flavitalea sp.]
MKTNTISMAALAVGLCLSLISCKKDMVNNMEDETLSRAAKLREPVKRAYRDSFDTQFQFIPDIANGWDPENPTPFLAWYPGNGDGNASHMGKAKTYFNQYVPFNPPFFSSIPAPVNMFFSEALALAGYPGIPDAVNSIVYDKKGNSIWFRQTSNSTSPESATRINFTGTSSIIGGTGKFVGATGEVTLNGYFNPLDQQDASVWTKGWISY